MKVFIIASMILGGSSAVALTNDEVKEEVRGFVEERVNDRMQARHEDRLEKLREEGIVYPESEEFLALTEEQQTAIYALIDEYNANNDFSVLTDEEIKEVMEAFKADLEALAEELGFELPERPTRGEIREKVRENMKERMEEKRAEYIESIKVDGFYLPNQEKMFEHLTEEQQAAVLVKIDEINATYDFSTMTDEEIDEVLLTIRDEFKVLFEELGVEFPTPHKEGYRDGFKHGYKHGYRKGFEDGQNQSPEDDTLPPEDGDTV